MSLPRYLNNSFGIWLDSLDKWELFSIGFIGCRDNYIYGKTVMIGQDNPTKIIDLLRGYYRKTHRPSERIVRHDQKITTNKFLYYEIENREYVKISEKISVPISIRKKYDDLQEKKAKEAFESIQTQIKLSNYQNKIYSSRVYPPTLKALIFERDGFKCSICGRNVDLLKKLGLHLEVDHIVEYEDGGLTTLSNGQTVCSECNKGKYHSKFYRNNRYGNA